MSINVLSDILADFRPFAGTAALPGYAADLISARTSLVRIMSSIPARSTLTGVPLNIASLITEVRGQRIILDADLARIYGVETHALNQAVKRNQERFPSDFMFKLTREKIVGISQTMISLRKLKFSR